MLLLSCISAPIRGIFLKIICDKNHILYKWFKVCGDQSVIKGILHEDQVFPPVIFLKLCILDITIIQ
jgi:hypothetical protein